MTDRHSGYIVTLKNDVRSDDAEHILSAIQMIKGVLSVKPIVSDSTQHIAEERRDREWKEALWNLATEGPSS